MHHAFSLLTVLRTCSSDRTHLFQHTWGVRDWCQLTVGLGTLDQIRFSNPKIALGRKRASVGEVHAADSTKVAAGKMTSHKWHVPLTGCSE